MKSENKLYRCKEMSKIYFLICVYRIYIELSFWWHKFVGGYEGRKEFMEMENDTKQLAKELFAIRKRRSEEDDQRRKEEVD